MAPKEKNPYLGKGKNSGMAPLLMKVPMYDFENAPDVELGLETEELCIARIPNSKEKGYTHHVGLVYKTNEGEVMSLTMTQHHGDLKPGTSEHLTETSDLKRKEDLKKDPLPKVEIKEKKLWQFWK